MRFDKIPESNNRVKLYCDYDEFDMTLVSLEELGTDYNNNYKIAIPKNNLTAELKTNSIEYHNILTKIMYNYSNISTEKYSILYFSLETKSDIFKEGIIRDIREDINSEKLDIFVTIDFNYRISKENTYDTCESSSA